MAASKTGLQAYGNVFAAKITEIEPYNLSGISEQAIKENNLQEARTIHFVKPTGPSRAHMKAEWVISNQPEVGGYFVVEDGPDGKTRCRYMKAEEFETLYG